MSFQDPRVNNLLECDISGSCYPIDVFVALYPQSQITFLKLPLKVVP